MSDELTNLPATRLVALMREGAVSPVEVLEAHLARAARLNSSINAVVTFAPDALDLARAAEREIFRGASSLALHGLPVTVKDTIDTRGLRTTSGSPARASRVPGRDAPSVARLRAAGAIIFGKTNTSELALDYACENPVFGRTVNPHDSALTPGGSSGGCAAAVSARLTPASLGSDMTGSIRIPAHFCGVLGLKPTAGRVEGAGHFPPTEGACSHGASIGPLARTAGDLELLFDALTDFDGRPPQPPTPDPEPQLKGLRAAFYADDRAAPVTDETRRAVEAAARALADAGCELREELPPGIERGPELWAALFSRDIREVVRETYAGREDLQGPAARALLGRAPAGLSADEYLGAWLERDRLRARLVEWMRETPLVVAPVGAVAAFEHGARKVQVGGETVSLFRAFGYSQTFNAYGLPAVSIPAGRSREGLPVGVQIVGPPHAERLVLAATRAVERALGGWQPPAPF